VFLAAAFYFYLRPFLNVGQFIYSFLILLAVSFLVVLSIQSQWLLAVSLFFGCLFFLLLGIKNLIFIRRQPAYILFNGFLFLTVAILFFRSDVSPLFFIKYPALFLACFLLLKEFLFFSAPEPANSRKRNLIIGGAAFLILQLFWAIALLPLSFLNAASLVLLALLILEDFIVRHLTGMMSRQIVLRNITVFLVLTLLIFGASQWSL